MEDQSVTQPDNLHELLRDLEKPEDLQSLKDARALQQDVNDHFDRIFYQNSEMQGDQRVLSTSKLIDVWRELVKVLPVEYSVNASQARALAQVLDPHKLGFVEHGPLWRKLCDVMKTELSQMSTKLQEHEEFKKMAFNLFASDPESGYITYDDLCRCRDLVKINLSDERIQNMIDVATEKTSETRVSFLQFAKVIKKYFHKENHKSRFTSKFHEFKDKIKASCELRVALVCDYKETYKFKQLLDSLNKYDKTVYPIKPSKSSSKISLPTLFGVLPVMDYTSPFQNASWTRTLFLSRRHDNIPRKTLKTVIKAYFLNQMANIIEDPPTCPKHWIHGSLLYVAQNSFADSTWKSATRAWDKFVWQELFKYITQNLGITHIAMQAPIPIDDRERKPRDLVPLYGCFGQNYESESFSDAYWVEFCENTIYQVYAPMHTMASRGNVIEKARILSLKSDIIGSTVVDFYCGIGYFSFSYLKAGAAKLYGFELNPWSIEGFRRGAGRNGFTCTILSSDQDATQIASDAVVFEEDNSNAISRLKDIKNIRHINLGILPSSPNTVWHVAATLIDCDLGGVIRIHENVIETKIACRQEELTMYFKEFYKTTRPNFIVSTKHFCVKQFAPRVYHVVYDITCGPALV